MSRVPVARLRALITSKLTQTATLYREVTALDVYGSPEHTLETVGSVSCRLIRAGNAGSGGAVQQAGERERLVQEYRLILSYGTTIGAGYLVGVGGVRYRVVRVRENMADAVDVQAVLVEDDT